MLTAALISAVWMPVAVSAPVSGSYSITAPSGNDQCRASADADGAGLLSENTPGSTKPVSSSPPRQRTSTCSPTDGALHERERPARAVSQCSQSVVLFPVSTRQSPSSRLTAATVPMRIRLRSRRRISLICSFMALVLRRTAGATINRRPLINHRTGYSARRLMISISIACISASFRPSSGRASYNTSFTLRAGRSRSP
ncbi:hypothetical protein G184_gp40 [Erwinia phage ENT90]|uniref:Uncharacterized protein n=1 Tax=Erwinia phage ENT90 TaxID=947843 RepID=F1BUP6_9CAUD|nr:hypothetical protein G184_gp40 [Erwinia phage ENT90]ADX32422.1 hypothetical protein [Erwinia phage ENT90]